MIDVDAIFIFGYYVTSQPSSSELRDNRLTARSEALQNLNLNNI